jgi:hypothetical protein
MALNLILGGLRLNRGDNQGIRYWAPGIFLRLNMDQVSGCVRHGHLVDKWKVRRFLHA